MFVVCCMLYVVWCLIELFVVCSLMFTGCCVLFVVYWLLCCLLVVLAACLCVWSVAHGELLVVRCALCVACCAL